jgi:hypothetical protein
VRKFQCLIAEKAKMISGRALHFVFKVADRTLTAKFYREVLGMKVTFCTCQLHFFWLEPYNGIQKKTRNLLLAFNKFVTY